VHYKGKVNLCAEQLAVWDFMLDVNKFSACMPGVEDLTRVDDATFTGTMKAKVGPISGAFAFEAHIIESEAPKQLKAHVEGTDSLTKSTMTSDITMDIASLDAGGPELTYAASIDLKGRLAIIGDMVIRATGAQVIKVFFERMRERIDAANHTREPEVTP
jgi:carbon monoxide dehydrogenase subunit G